MVMRMVNALVLILVALRFNRWRAIFHNAVLVLITTHIGKTDIVIDLITTVFAVASALITGLPVRKVLINSIG